MTNTPVPGDSNRWRGYAHKDLYTMLHDGPGATASAEPSRRWSEVASTLTEIGQDLGKALELTGAGWQGRAAGAAYTRLSTTVAWATTSGAGAAQMRTFVEDQGDHIARARADMPQPEDVPAAQPDPTTPPAVQVVEAQTDAEPAEAAASSAQERAVEVMTAYETNTNATTAALPTFEEPEKVRLNNGVQQGQGVGLIGGLTSAAGLGGGRNRQDEHRRDDRGGSRGGGHGPTHTSGAEFHQSRQRSMSQPLAQGRTMGVSGDPFFAMGAVDGDRTRERRPGRSTTAIGGGGGGGGGGGVPGPKSSLPGMPGNELQAAQQAQQAAAASHAAHPGAPIAPTTGAAGTPDKMAMRKLGMDAIGSSQWFGDPEEPVPGQSQKRRFDLRESAETEEPSSILDEENQLPPNVIGEGGR
jgi:hypothetical protein